MIGEYINCEPTLPLELDTIQTIYRTNSSASYRTL